MDFLPSLPTLLAFTAATLLLAATPGPDMTLSISRALNIGEAEFKTGVRQTNRLIASMQRPLLEQHLSIDYIAAVDAYSLKPVEVIAAPTVLAIAARVGATRLIDNVVVNL